MAGFKTHITTSTVLGVGIGAAGYMLLGIPLDTSILAAGLCSIAGMLPDLDSDSGVPVREMFAFLAAFIPMLMMDRFTHMGLTGESMVLAGGIVYVVIRFGVSRLLKRYTVHRGMFHSLPALAIASLVGYLVCTCHDETERLFKTAAIALGFFSHLLLDELYSIEFRRGRTRLKKSFGTAIKLWGGNTWANISTYAKLILLLALAFGDPIIMEHVQEGQEEVERIATGVLDKVRR